MDRVVALKVLPAGIAADTKACTRFMREAQTAGKLNHPNVVGVYLTGVKEGTPWYSMEYVEGETLAQVLAKMKEAEPETDTPFGRKDCAGYFEQLARAFADVAAQRQAFLTFEVGEAEVEDAEPAFRIEYQIRGLDVAVDDAPLVSVLEAVGYRREGPGDSGAVEALDPVGPEKPPGGSSVDIRLRFRLGLTSVCRRSRTGGKSILVAVPFKTVEDVP